MDKSRIKTKIITCSQDFEKTCLVYAQHPWLYKHTNCYSYALGLPEAGIAQPGHLAKTFGKVAQQDCRVERLKDLLNEDGLIEIAAEDVPYNDTQVIALMITAYQGAHFLKYHRDGTWSHQYGMSGPILDRDDDDKLMVDPYKVHLKSYDQCVGFFRTPAEGINYIPRVSLDNN